MDSATHIAGPPITVNGRVIQRCSLCGYKLCDNLRVMMPTKEGEETPVFPTWEVGRLVRVTEGNPTGYILLPETDKLPDDSCIDLVED